MIQFHFHHKTIQLYCHLMLHWSDSYCFHAIKKLKLKRDKAITNDQPSRTDHLDIIIEKQRNPSINLSRITDREHLSTLPQMDICR